MQEYLVQILNEIGSNRDSEEEIEITKVKGNGSTDSRTTRNQKSLWKAQFR